MASIRWIGRAQAIAQVNTVTMAGAGDWVTGDTVTLTINDKALVVTVGASLTDADVAITVKEAWENETLTDTTASYTPADGGQDIIEHSLITATVSGDVVTLTADTPGVPFTLTVTETTSGDETATGAVATAATGPNHWDNADNWSTGSVPTTGDDLFFDNSDVSVLWALGQSSVDPASITIYQSYTGDIGLPKTNPAGYVEYFGDYLEIDVNTLVIGRDNGTGSGRIKIDSGSNTTAIIVENTGNPAESDLEAFLWKGSDVSNSIEVHNGSVAAAAFGGESATLNTTRVVGGSFRGGEGFAAGTDLTNTAGTVSLVSNVGTLVSDGGQVEIGGSATITTATITGGRLVWNSSGTITTVTNGGGRDESVIDASGNNSSSTFTNYTQKARARLIDPLRTVTKTNDVVIGDDVSEVITD